MTSQGALKWIKRLKQPRTLDSLILEAYGEVTWLGCLLELEVADMMNYMNLATAPIESLKKKPFDTRKKTLSQLIDEAEKSGVLSNEHVRFLKDARDDRNELVHRLVGTELVITNAEKELLIAKIDELYVRIQKAHQLASSIKKRFAEQLGFPEASVLETLHQQEEEAKIENQNISRILGLDEDQPERRSLS